MKVYLSFDVEIWCNDWRNLDARFPASFERYVYGRSPRGDYALPKTLEILARHGLHGVFFVEPLFAARFGVEHLATVVGLIQDAGQEVQLHLHPEWTDEIRPLPIPGATHKRQHLSYYTLDEQSTLISLGMTLLAQAGCAEVQAFRAGSFAANADTFRALARCGIAVDSSLNLCHPDSGTDLRNQADFEQPSEIDGVAELPMAIFTDGLGRLRPAQIGACSFAEMRQAMECSARSGAGHFVVLSHNFEMLRQGRSTPDSIVVRRFESLCAYLGREHRELPTASLRKRPTIDAAPATRPRVSALATGRRVAEQALRRLAG